MNTILCRRTERTLRNDFTVAHSHKLYQIEETIHASKVMAQDRIDNSIRIHSRGRALRFEESNERPVREKKQPVAARMRKSSIPSPNHRWRWNFKFGSPKYERGKPIDSKT